MGPVPRSSTSWPATRAYQREVCGFERALKIKSRLAHSATAPKRCAASNDRQRAKVELSTAMSLHSPLDSHPLLVSKTRNNLLNVFYFICNGLPDPESSDTPTTLPAYSTAETGAAKITKRRLKTPRRRAAAKGFMDVLASRLREGSNYPHILWITSRLKAESPATQGVTERLKSGHPRARPVKKHCIIRWFNSNPRCRGRSCAAGIPFSRRPGGSRCCSYP